MRTPASIAGHPVHPIVAGIPIGLWIVSFVADVCGLMQLAPGRDIWHQVAYLTMLGGIIGALAGAIPGLIDLFSIDDRRLRRTGLVYLSINLAVAALFVANAFLRQGSGFAGADLHGPVLLSAGALLLSAGAGWLGGKLLLLHEVVATTTPIPRARTAK